MSYIIEYSTSAQKVTIMTNEIHKFESNESYFRFISYLCHQNVMSMTKINNEKEYKLACDRINELLKVVNGQTPLTDPNMIELNLISDLVADYEELHYPVKPLSLAETIELRMYEMGLTRTNLSEMLNLSKSTISDILNGKREPTLKTARDISRKLNIDASVVLGV